MTFLSEVTFPGARHAHGDRAVLTGCPKLRAVQGVLSDDRKALLSSTL